MFIVGQWSLSLVLPMLLHYRYIDKYMVSYLKERDVQSPRWITLIIWILFILNLLQSVVVSHFMKGLYHQSIQSDILITGTEVLVFLSPNPHFRRKSKFTTHLLTTVQN